jgi:hypothetical protein
MSERIIVNLDRFVIILVIVCIIYYLLNLKSICLYVIAVTVTVDHWQKLNNTRTLSSCALYIICSKLIPSAFIIFTFVAVYLFYVKFYCKRLRLSTLLINCFYCYYYYYYYYHQNNARISLLI